MRQLDRGMSAQATDIPVRYLQICAGGDRAVAMTDDLGRDERLYEVYLPANDGLPANRLIYATLGETPTGPAIATTVPLNTGVRLATVPDVLNRYALRLRDNEVGFAGGQIPAVNTSKRPGGLAGGGAPPVADRQTNLRNRIAREEAALARLDRQRSEAYVAALSGTVSDTLPPRGTGQSAATRTRYSQELDELARMKEKFRQQQEQRMRDRDRGTPILQPWSEQSAAAAPPVSRQPALDSTLLRSGVRSGLYPDQRPSAYERRGWENDVSYDLPPPGEFDSAESIRLDSMYARQLREVEALRAQLRESRTETTARAVAPPTGTVTPPAGALAARVLPISFIRNTAYPNSGGYAGLEELATAIRRSGTILEVRVHTARELDRRAAQLLSEERAVTIRNFLTEAGIASENYRVIGFGNHESAAGERVELLTAQ